MAQEHAVAEKPFRVSLADNTVSLAAMKKADGREAVLFRLHNNTQGAVETALTVNDAVLPLSFGAFEVKTVLLENGTLQEHPTLII